MYDSNIVNSRQWGSKNPFDKLRNKNATTIAVVAQDFDNLVAEMKSMLDEDLVLRPLSA